MAGLTAIGLMSGTSMDGVDAALLQSDGEGFVRTGPAITVPYPESFRDRLRGVLGRRGDAAGVAEIATELTDYHLDAVDRILKENTAEHLNVDVIGFHGQTILHQPEQRLTVQIGDAARLAARSGLPVAYDFRSADVAAGGQGAPLVPLFHAALIQDMERPITVLNIGGVANVTWIGKDNRIIAFDTGPGNAPIDDWVRAQAGRPHDEGGSLARGGKPDKQRVALGLGHDHFARRPPKSLDRNAFTAALADGMNAADGAATLTEFTAASIAEAARHFPEPARSWIVCGGGRHNEWLMERLAIRLAPARLIKCDTLGWDGNALEAQAFAYLAVRVMRGLPLSLPGTTGVPRPMPGGKIARP